MPLWVVPGLFKLDELLAVAQLFGLQFGKSSSDGGFCVALWGCFEPWQHGVPSCHLGALRGQDPAHQMLHLCFASGEACSEGLTCIWSKA